VTESIGVNMMFPLLAVAMKHALLEQAAPSIAVIEVGPAFKAVVGPLIGFPSWYQVKPPLFVAITVPMAPPAKQSDASKQATELSACGAFDVCTVQVDPLFVLATIAAVVPPVGIAPTA
jgi:hypothetical protein